MYGNGFGKNRSDKLIIWAANQSLNTFVITLITALSSGVYTRIKDTGIPLEHYNINCQTRQTVNNKSKHQMKTANNIVICLKLTALSKES